MENKDFNFEEIRKKMENYQEAPSKEMWKNIEKQINPKYTYLKAAIGVTTAILVAFVGILVFTPSKQQEEKPIIAKTLNNTKSMERNAENKTKKYSEKTKKNSEKTKKYSEKTKKNFEKTKKNFEKTKIFSEPNTIIIPSVQEITKTESQLAETKSIEPQIIEKPAEKILEKQETTLKLEIVEEKIEEKTPETEEVINRTRLIIPNAFTPSTGDENSIFKPAPTELKDYRMNIYNSNGIMVFTTNDIEQGWDGTYKDNPQPMGVYIYIVKFTNQKGETNTQKGELMLIR